MFNMMILTSDYTDLVHYYIYLQVSDFFNENENFLDTYQYRKGFNKNYDQKNSHCYYTHYNILLYHSKQTNVDT